MIGTTEILIVAGVIVLLFGASAIPKFARNIGRAKREFEKGMKDGAAEAEKDDDAPPSREDSGKSREREI